MTILVMVLAALIAIAGGLVVRRAIRQRQIKQQHAQREVDLAQVRCERFVRVLIEQDVSPVDEVNLGGIEMGRVFSLRDKIGARIRVVCYGAVVVAYASSTEAADLATYVVRLLSGEPVMRAPGIKVKRENA